MFGHGSCVHQKCSNYALTNLLFGLCNSMWIIDLLVIFPNPYLRSPTHPFTLEMLWVKEYPNSSFFHCVCHGFTFEFIKKLGSASFVVPHLVLLLLVVVHHSLFCVVACYGASFSPCITIVYYGLLSFTLFLVMVHHPLPCVVVVYCGSSPLPCVVITFCYGPSSLTLRCYCLL